VPFDPAALLRALLPRRCPACRQSLGQDAGVCSSCLNKWSAQITDASTLRETRIPHLIYLGEYFGPLRRTVSALKYAGSRDIAPRVAPLLAKRIPAWWQLEGVCAVPLHRKRQRQRGFNQSELIALEVAKIRGLPYLNALERVRSTRQQAKLHGLERQKNVQNAFKVTSSVGGNVLLVDDVFTTGATLRDCERALLEAGAKQVYFMVLAR